MLSSPEIFISVDVETAGPYPGRYSLLSIGACRLDDPAQSFYVEFKPISDEMTESAFAVSGLSLDELARTGVDPAEAMRQFADWIGSVSAGSGQPVMVGFNAPFDWSFVNYYFWTYLDYNPFGHAALDVKAFYMGMTGSAWSETSMASLSPRYLAGEQLPHNALADARLQAQLFRQILEQSRQKTEEDLR